MSGRHRVQRPARRVQVRLLLVPVRIGWRGVRGAWTPVAEAWTRLIERLRERFENTDPFAGVSFAASTTSPDPIPALPAPVEEPQETAQERLTAEQALRALHGQHPHLPGAHIRWHLFDGAVAGEVYALDATEAGQRNLVQQYADALAAEVTEHPDGPHVTVATVGVFAGVTFTIAAVLLHDDTMPLRVFDEAAADPTVGDATLSTQQIPESLLAEVVGAA